MLFFFGRTLHTQWHYVGCLAGVGNLQHNISGWGFSAWTEKRLEARCKSQLLGLEKDMVQVGKALQVRNVDSGKQVQHSWRFSSGLILYDEDWWTISSLMNILVVFDTRRLLGRSWRCLYFMIPAVHLYVSTCILTDLELLFRRLMILLQHGSLKGRINTSIALVQKTEECRYLFQGIPTFEVHWLCCCPWKVSNVAKIEAWV